MGKAGRTYKEITGEPVARITGCDPAGPRFVDGPIFYALPKLNENRLNPESAAFVDVIHTNAALQPGAVWIIPRLGDLHPLGHMDFYPNGGSSQPGCSFYTILSGDNCSHMRSYLYLLHSIREPNLFPSKECKTTIDCNHKEVISNDIAAFMGEKSQVILLFNKPVYEKINQD